MSESCHETRKVGRFGGEQAVRSSLRPCRPVFDMWRHVVSITFFFAASLGHI
jgi:hypothetical protein